MQVETDFAIGPALKADAPAILEVQRRAFAEEAALYGSIELPPLQETLDALLSIWDRWTILKVTTEAGIIGSGRARAKGRSAHIARLSIDPPWQGRGIGAKLVRALEEASPQAERFELFTGSLSHGNIRLYERLGYTTYKQSLDSMGVGLVHMERLC